MGRNIRNRTHLCHRSSMASTSAFSMLLGILIWLDASISFSPTHFCCGHKASVSTSFSCPSWKPSKQAPRTESTPIVLGIKSNQHQITPRVPRLNSKNEKSYLKKKRISSIHAAYQIPSHYAPRSGGSIALFSKDSDTMDSISEGDDGNADNKSIRNNHSKRFSVWKDFLYGANVVHKDFLNLFCKVYSRTILWMAPIVVLLNIILPACSASPSPFLQLLAIRVQGFLKSSCEILTEISRVLFLRPMYLCSQLITSSVQKIGDGVSKTAWMSNGYKMRYLLWGLLWAPVLEEFTFRLAFRGIWKRLFRPITIRSNNSNKNNQNTAPEGINQGLRSYLPKLLLFPWGSDKNKKPNRLHTNQSWRVASAICFGISHFSNHFPLDFSKHTINGELQLPCKTPKDLFLLRLFPGNFASLPANREFCVINMTLVAAFYQATHCFINTMILYAPLLDSKSKHGGVFAAIGAHVAWNSNTYWLAISMKLRLLLKFAVATKQKLQVMSDKNTKGQKHQQ